MAIKPRSGTPPQVLLAGPLAESGPIPALLKNLGLRTRKHDLFAAPGEGEIEESDLAVVGVDWPELNGQAQKVVELVESLARSNIATFVVGVPEHVEFRGSPLIERAPARGDASELAGRLRTFARYGPLVKRLERELDHLQRLGKRLNHYFAQVDAEMRLAGRLQRDFLPRSLPSMPPLRFETLFRPATWVSGDIYDVFRLDERHVGVFMADAVGHGLASGLLTMFLRQALVTRETRPGQPSPPNPMEPADVIGQLHRTLLAQALPNCWFVTASYSLIDTTTLEVRHARGGHPYALVIRANGRIHELQPAGCLIGVPDVDGVFGQESTPLNAGDKLVQYSDGLEAQLVISRDSSGTVFTPQLEEWARLPAREFVAALNAHIDRYNAEANAADDVSLVVTEVAA